MNNQNGMNSNNMNKGYDIMGSSNKNNFIPITVLIGLIVIVVLILLFIFSKEDKLKNIINNGFDNQIDDSQKLEKNIKIDSKKLSNGDIVLIVNNNNNLNVTLNVEIKFYDKNKELIDIDDNIIIDVEKKSKACDYDYIFRKYETYEISFKAETNDYIQFVDKKDYEVTYKINDNKVLIQTKNKSDKNINTIDSYFIFYKNNEVIACNSVLVRDLRAKGEKSDKIYLPTNDRFNVADYDKIEVYSNAYNYED